MNTPFFANEQDLSDFFSFTVKHRLNFRYWLRNTLLKIKYHQATDAAVLVGFHYQPEIKSYAIVLTLRSANLKKHANQIAFPGGKKEQQDLNITETAIRETMEEIGLARNDIKTYGICSAIRTATQFNTYPILAMLTTAPEVEKINPDEVKEVFSVPCTILLNADAYYFKTTKLSKIPVNIACIDYAEKHIWGLTAEILFYLAKSYQKFRSSKK